MITIKIAKTNKDEQIVFGWANISIKSNGEVVKDLQDDMIDIDDLEQAVYGFVLDYREAGERHVKKGVGRLAESIVFTPEKIKEMGLENTELPQGWWVGFKIDDKKVWDKIVKKEYLMFSIEGTGTREEA